jgi:excisionase family DNA binding protein
VTDSKHETFLTVAEVAARLRVSKMTVHRLIDERFELRAFRVGRSIRVYESAVDEFLAAAEIDVNS